MQPGQTLLQRRRQACAFEFAFWSPPASVLQELTAPIVISWCTPTVRGPCTSTFKEPIAQAAAGGLLQHLRMRRPGHLRPVPQVPWPPVRDRHLHRLSLHLHQLQVPRPRLPVHHRARGPCTLRYTIASQLQPPAWQTLPQPATTWRLGLGLSVTRTRRTPKPFAAGRHFGGMRTKMPPVAKLTCAACSNPPVPRMQRVRQLAMQRQRAAANAITRARDRAPAGGAVCATSAPPMAMGNLDMCLHGLQRAPAPIVIALAPAPAPLLTSSPPPHRGTRSCSRRSSCWFLMRTRAALALPHQARRRRPHHRDRRRHLWKRVRHTLHRLQNSSRSIARACADSCSPTSQPSQIPPLHNNQQQQQPSSRKRKVIK